MLKKFLSAAYFSLAISFILSAYTESIYTQEYWIHKPSPTSVILNKIIFTDSLYGWVSGDSGTVLHTINGGDDWSFQSTGVIAYPIDDMYFINRRLGWAISNTYFYNGTRILKTTNSGLNWQLSIYPDTNIVFNCIYFRDSLTGFMGAYTGEIFKTSNAGSSWFKCGIDSSICPFYLFPKLGIDFLNAQTGYMCGGVFDRMGLIWKTTNAGLNWSSFCVSPEPVKKIMAINSSKVMSAGGDREFGAITVQSQNAGTSWLYDTLGIFGMGNSLAYRTPKELWVPLTFSQTWAVNLDSGSYTSQWIVIPTPDSMAVYDAVFKSPTFGWACGIYGGLMKYNPAIIGIQETGNSIPYRSRLYQNYPNPFNPKTTIKYYIAKTANVKLAIYDLAGREVRKYILGIKTPGSYDFVFTSLNFASGVYIYKLQAGDYSETKKMVIIK